MRGRPPVSRMAMVGAYAIREQFYTGGMPGMAVNLRQPEVGCFANISAQPAAAAAILHVP